MLKEEPQHATVSERVTSRFTRSHYRQFDLDNAFSAKIFDRYLNLLDYSHNVLLASDVAKFAAKKDQIGDELRSGKLDVFLRPLQPGAAAPLRALSVCAEGA
ncbi:Tail-specific protease precursor [Klebsiella pneumoniae IS43]|uniref:Tail-specific protease n=1 Tax=Klebsiella pneumoniae IS43 TaxID=1432552 RepID=W1DD68_KLEPN|nr:Tail-specific protease precursor [Klebsiella pneumoniae IS43]